MKNINISYINMLIPPYPPPPLKPDGMPNHVVTDHTASKEVD